MPTSESLRENNMQTTNGETGLEGGEDMVDDFSGSR